ncbi:glucan biosynthesis protein [Halomonas sp. GD1P12]|uniref:glucan biosynthesis protein n=1 Tax=Halomonas sp. GD1P12 TaxID=2982691 RepID=UPI0021E407A0|nr:glucan biosynthesis protein G [Halomonas sp. GD1P12]UYG00879.1 glucan biosynthesis protein G [Halomonas sp. GD1P12]
MKGRIGTQWLIALGLANASISQADDTFFDNVIERAKTLAEAPYTPPNAPLSSALENLDYDAYRQIRFDPERAYWRDESPFSLQLFHSGFLFKEPVTLNIIDDGQSEPLPFQRDDFRYEGQARALSSEDLTDSGHAGFRLHYPINDPDYRDEVAAFLGASYFRLVGRDQVYGLSARGLAIDTASSKPEEFPRFSEFWFFKPQQGDQTLTFLALLDSPSISGAYRFTLTPGEQTNLEVEAELFAREDIDKLGVAPLTSMFAFGDVTAHRPDDFRPQVHDSDGLLMHTGQNEWIWRPLSNPSDTRLSLFSDDDPAGFGLMQRERDFDRYLDMEALYHRRPSQWVEPLANWGPGHVELVELPTPDETHDNIVAYWVFDAPLEAGESLALHYRTYTLNDTPEAFDQARVFRTRQGQAGLASDPAAKAQRQFVVDFEGGALEGLNDDASITLFIDTGEVEAREAHVLALPRNRWRASFRVPANATSDIRLRLEMNGEPISETWNYVWTPDD